MVETGLIGFISILFVVGYYILKSPNSIYKYAFLVLVVHSLFDLNFSYMLILAIFGILLGINEFDKSKRNRKKYMYLEYIVAIITFVFTFILVIKLNLAYYMKVPNLDNNITFSKQAALVSYLEKRVMLDSADNKYRKTLANEYNNYLEMIMQNIQNDTKNINLVNESKNIIMNIEKNAEIMKQNEKVSKDTLIDISNIYFNNIVYLVKTNFKEDIESGYRYYFDIIKSNLEFIEKNYKYNNLAKELLSECYSKYYEQLNKNNLSIKAIDDFLEYIKAKK